MSNHDEVDDEVDGPTEVSRRGFMKGTAVVALTLASAPLLAACSKSTSKGTTSVPGGTGVTKSSVRILIGFGTGNDPEQTPPQEKIANSLGGTGRIQSVSFDRVPDSDAATQKLTLQIAAGKPPQLILPTGLFGINTFIEKGVWEDLGPRMAAEGLKLDDLFLENTLAAARGIGYYPASSAPIVGIPTVVHGHFVGVNIDLFKKAGVPVPSFGWNDPEWTYDKLLELALATTLDKRGRRASDPAFDAKNIAQYGIGRIDVAGGFDLSNTPVDPVTRKVNYDKPGVIEGTQFAADLKNRYKVVPDDAAAAAVSGATQGSDAQLMAWLSGKVAMTDLCTCDLPTYGAVKGFAWSAIATPKGPKRLATLLNLDFGAVVAADKGNKAVDASWEALKGFLFDPANEKAFSYDSLRGVPALKANSGIFVDAVKRNYPNLDATIVAGGITFGVPMSELWYPAYNELGSAVSPIFDKVSAGEITAAEAAPQAVAAGQAAVDAWLAANKLPGG